MAQPPEQSKQEPDVCKFSPICVTFNWYKEEKAKFIEECCKTKNCTSCTYYMGLEAQMFTKGTDLWNKIAATIAKGRFVSIAEALSH